MHRTEAQTYSTGLEWRETLQLAVELSLPAPFNLEWLIDRAERGEWSGLWW